MAVAATACTLGTDPAPPQADAGITLGTDGEPIFDYALCGGGAERFTVRGSDGGSVL